MDEISAFLSKCKDSVGIKKLLSKDFLSKLGREVHFIQRQRRLRAAAFCYVCLFCGCSAAYPSLNEFRISLWEHFGIKMSKSSLSERFTPQSVQFMKSLFEKILVLKWEKIRPKDWLSGFSDVLVSDSSIINLSDQCAKLFPGFGGGASQACSKIQLTMSLLNGRFEELLLLAGRKPDSAHRFGQIRAGALYLFDLAYTGGANLKAIIKGKAWFVCRYKYKTNLYLPDGTLITQQELQKSIRRLKPWARIEIDVLLTDTHRIPCRLILQKLPKEIADQIRNKLKTDKQKKCKNLSEDRLEFCQVNAFVTNLPAEKLPADLSRAYYSIRWQIEIIFKTWKSCIGVDKTRDIGPYQFQTCLYGYLIRILITTRLFWAAKINAWQFHKIELSELKAFKELAHYQEKLFRWLVSEQRKNESFLEDLYQKLTLFCRKERKKNTSTPWEILNEST